MKLNELLTNIKGKIPIILKINDSEIDAVTFQGTKSFVCLSEEYTKGKKTYGNAIVTNVGIVEEASEPHILIEAETTTWRWTKRNAQNNMNNYLTKKVVYFNYQQFLKELEELKKKYYVIGYTVKSQENTADVQLVEKYI